MKKETTVGQDPISAFPTEMHTGLTKREYIASMALSGLLADPSRGAFDTLAKVAVTMADALIEELNK